MGTQSTKAKVGAGLRRVGFWLAGMLWFGLVIAGIGITFRPDQTPVVVTQSPHPPIIGWLLLALAGLILILTADRWIKVLPALLGVGTLGGIMIMASGHELNHPEIHVSLRAGAGLTFFLALSAILSSTFVGRPLHIWDRCALFGFVCCFFGQVVDPKRTVEALAIGLACLLGAWISNYFLTKRSLTP
jgi:hypothetical protein